LVELAIFPYCRGESPFELVHSVPWCGFGLYLFRKTFDSDLDATWRTIS